MRRVKTAVIGTGFMGKVHSEAIRRLGHVDIVAVAAHHCIGSRCVRRRHRRRPDDGRLQRIIGRPRHRSRPRLHAERAALPVAKDALAGRQGRHLRKAAGACPSQKRRKWWSSRRSKGLPNCVNHNLRFYPMVQHMRRMIESGDLGEILVVQGTYSQDWLLYDTDYNWRIEKAANGPLRVVGDIGSHWMDMAQHLTGQRSPRFAPICRSSIRLAKSRRRPSKHSPARR